MKQRGNLSECENVDTLGRLEPMTYWQKVAILTTMLHSIESQITKIWLI